MASVYEHSEKGVDRRKKYRSSEKSKENRKKYKNSETGRKALDLSNKVSRISMQRVGGREIYNSLSVQDRKALRSSIKNEILAEEAISSTSAEQLNVSFSEMAIAQRERFIASLPESSRNDLFSLNKKNIFPL